MIQSQEENLKQIQSTIIIVKMAKTLLLLLLNKGEMPIQTIGCDKLNLYITILQYIKFSLKIAIHSVAKRKN